MRTELLRYGALYQEGKQVLKGFPEADLDARLLLEEACGTQLQTLLVTPDREVSAAEAERYRSFLNRRKAHEPLAMITGHTGFMGLEFKVTRDVLIPEQDTEILVEEAIREATEQMNQQSQAEAFSFLDLCTGSGCIALSLLHYLMQSGKNTAAAGSAGTVWGAGRRAPESRAIRVNASATDLSAAALAVAAENAVRLGWQAVEEVPGQYEQNGCLLVFTKGDLFDALQKEGTGRTAFNLIVSNPPYIPADVIPSLAPEVRLGEPAMALCGGTDGLVFYRRIAAQAPAYLQPGGRLILEIGYDQGKSVPALLAAAGFDGIRVLQDYGGRDRVVVCRKNQSKR